MRLFVLIGPPCIGKTTWVLEHAPSAFVVSRDDIVDEFAAVNGLKHDDVVVNEQYASKIETLLAERRSKAIVSKRDIVVVDMTNLTRKGRRHSVSAFSRASGAYEKIAVVFEFSGFRQPLIQNSWLRSRQLNDKHIPVSVYKRAFDCHQGVAPEEGFDHTIVVDTRKKIENVLNEYNTLGIFYVSSYELRQMMSACSILPVHIKGFANGLDTSSVHLDETGLAGLLARIRTRAEQRDGKQYEGGVMVVWDGDALKDDSFTRFIRDLKVRETPLTGKISFAFAKATGGAYGDTFYKNVRQKHDMFVRNIRMPLQCPECPLYFIKDVQEAFDAAASDMTQAYEANPGSLEMSTHKQALQNYKGAYGAFADRCGGRPTFAFLGEAILRCTQAADVVYIGKGPTARVEHAYSRLASITDGGREYEEWPVKAAQKARCG